MIVYDLTITYAATGETAETSMTEDMARNFYRTNTTDYGVPQANTAIPVDQTWTWYMPNGNAVTLRRWVDESVIDDTCTRCYGDGKLSYYGHIQGGVCFQCGGSGKHILTH